MGPVKAPTSRRRKAWMLPIQEMLEGEEVGRSVVS
jgi:hypothetical protein